MIAKCKDCGKTIKVYNSLNRRCRDCTIKNYKPIPQIGRKTKEWMDTREEWLEQDRNDNGNWYCQECGFEIKHRSGVEYHHMKKRSTNPDKRLDRSNCRRLCEDCHLLYHQ